MPSEPVYRSGPWAYGAVRETAEPTKVILDQADNTLDHDGGKRVYGVQAPNRTTLVTWADGFTMGAGRALSPPFLRVVLPCGNVREYLNREDVPKRSVHCRCGEIAGGHWFVFYEEEAQ
jgi:hypothetical protein